MANRILAIVFALGIVFVSAAPAAATRSFVVAQGTDNEEGEGGQEGQGEGGVGQDDPEAETDPGAGGEAVEEETGPPWTYQMARMSVGLVILLLAGTAFLYYRMIGARQRGSA